jgi:prepilin-type N-terminal cleavage/methylation domain-containing protein
VPVVGRSGGFPSPACGGGIRRLALKALSRSWVGVSAGVQNTPPPSSAIGSSLAVATHPSPASRGGKSASPGFTLVELSIVLVIIGLILGGVMVGRSMIRSSQVNSVASDLQGFEAAMNLFVDKYQGLPGDITNATSFWTAAANGNGNGSLGAPGAANTAGETFGRWEQLALAGLIKGSYTGIAGPGAAEDVTLGVNVPKSKIAGAGYYGWGWGYVTGLANYYDGQYGDVIEFGAKTAAYTAGSPVLTPAEALILDTKMDDGLPAMGVLRTRSSGTASPNCSTGANNAGATATYNMAYTGVACNFVFSTGL